MRMLKDALLLLKKLRSRDKIEISLYFRLFVFFTLYLVAILTALFIILSATGTFRNEEQKSKLWMENEMKNLLQSVSGDFERLSVQGVKLANQISAQIENYLLENRKSWSSLSGSPEEIEQLLAEQMPELLSAAKNYQCSGVFFILNKNTSQQPADTKTGVFLKRTEPNVLHITSPQIYCLRGPASIARQYEIGLMGQWRMVFTENESSFYGITLNQAQEYASLGVSHLYYWSPRILLEENSEAGMLLCVPVLNKSGDIYGVCGIEVSAMLFKLRYSPDSSLYPHIFSVLAPSRDHMLDMEQGLLAGNSYLNSSLVGEAAKFQNSPSTFTEFITESGESYLGVQNMISLYPEDSPYQTQSWRFSLLTQKEELVKDFFQTRERLQLSLLLLLIVCIILASFVSRYYITPIVYTFDQIRNKGDLSSVPKTKLLEINDLLEFLSSQEETETEEAMVTDVLSEPESFAPSSKNNVTMEESDSSFSPLCNEKEIISSLHNDKLPILDKEKYVHFIESLKTLSPAEWRVFELYLKEYKAKEIANELHLSINTIKYHNANIYGKLQVNSRKELLSYIREMRHQNSSQEQGIDKALENDT